MTNITHQRLHNQHLSQQVYAKPEDVVSWLVAVQSQDYMGAKWAVVQRTRDSTDDAMEQAFTDGAVLRTHLMRPTWHFVAPADIRWLLMLTAPRVHASNAYMYRKLELDADIFKRSQALMHKSLEGGNQLTREQIAVVLQQDGIRTDGELRMGYILMHAELEMLICSGGRAGKQFTYALLDERVPATKLLTPDEALAELTRRYFASRAPAQLKDFATWSGLTLTSAKAGLEMVRSQLVEEVINGESYWLTDSTPTTSHEMVAYLLPNYDEYVSSYIDRSAIGDAQYADKWDVTRNVVLSHYVVMDGKIIGTWKRTLKKHDVLIETVLFRELSAAEQAAFAAAVQRYGDYLVLRAVLL